MTDRHSGYIVTLDHDIREDDAEQIIQALSMVKGVLAVEPLVRDGDLMITQARLRFDLQRKVHQAVQQVFEKGTS